MFDFKNYDVQILSKFPDRHQVTSKT